MKTGRITKFLILLFLTTVLPVMADSSRETSSSWETAVKIYDEYSGLKPYKMKVHSETYNRKGELEKTEELIYSISYNEAGETVNNLISAFEDGQDITEKKRKELEKDSNKGSHGGSPGDDMKGMDTHPLDPEVQNKVTAVPEGRTEFRENKPCEVWSFKVRLNDKYTGTGTAWLNSTTGEAVSLDYHIEPLFPFVEEMNINMNFSTDENEQWFLDNMRMTGRVNMIIMKKSFKAVTSFSDYR